MQLLDILLYCALVVQCDTPPADESARLLWPLLAEHERRTRSVAFCWVSLSIASNQVSAARALTTRIARADATGQDALLPRLVFGIAVDASLHPIRALFVPSLAVLAFGGLEVSQVLKHQDRRALLLRTIDKAT